jgi:hypothetical protein
LLACALTPLSTPATAGTAQFSTALLQTITPYKYITLSGSDSGAPVASLQTQDQTGSDDDASKYVAFKTPSVVYKGTQSFRSPSGVLPAYVTSMTFSVNFKGPAKATQSWKWQIYDWGGKKYVTLGDNAAATAGTWSLLTFNVASPARFINASTREIRMMILSGNSLRDAKVDYEAITIDYTIPPTATPTPTATPSPTPDPNGGPTIAGCPLFPVDNIWSARVDSLPVHARSNAWINSIGSSQPFHMDFGSGTWDGGPIGIPYNIVDGARAKVSVDFYYPDESDPGPYPNPDNLKREWGSDHHILTVDKDNCILYEIYDASKSAGLWYGGSGAIWDLRSNALRPAGWTSSDAAGLPILPGLVMYDEVASGVIKHAVRFTAENTNSYIWPARHLTSGTAGTVTNTPPMGARFRLKSSYDISGFSPEIQVILQAMKDYGIILADNGSNWYVSGAPDERWNNDHLHELDVLTGANFEAVDVSGLMVDPDSGAVR